MKKIKLTRGQSDALVDKVRGCVDRADRFARTHLGADHYAHLAGGLQGVLEEIEPRLIEVFRPKR